MSRLSFEDAFKNKMNDLPAGDENASWQKMKELLDEKEKRKPIAWLNIYAICGSIAVIATFCFWIISSDYKKQKENSITVKNNNSKNTLKNSEENANQLPVEEQKSRLNNIITQNSKTGIVSRQNNIPIKNIRSIKINSLHHNFTSTGFYNDYSVKRNENNKVRNDESILKQQAANSKDSINTSNRTADQTTFNKLQVSDSNNNSVSSTLNPLAEKNDSTRTPSASNNLKQSYNADSNTAKKQTQIIFKPRKQFFLEAGVQVKQQIPVAGQQLIAYNYNDNKNLAGDYLPSVFLKFEKDKQWFFQGEFNYATPHLIKAFSYSRQTRPDYNLSTVTITTNNLQKTYYTELPLTFNYYVQPHWFIGAGTSFNWFHGAVAEQEIITNDAKAGTINTVKQKIPFKNFNDSFLYNNQASLLLQTGYSLNRWSFILRYQKGIQPYIKYTLPDGTIESKKDNLLELRIGYGLIKKPLRFKSKYPLTK